MAVGKTGSPCLCYPPLQGIVPKPQSHPKILQICKIHHGAPCRILAALVSPKSPLSPVKKITTKDGNKMVYGCNKLCWRKKNNLFAWKQGGISHCHTNGSPVSHHSWSQQCPVERGIYWKQFSFTSIPPIHSDQLSCLPWDQMLVLVGE